VTPFTGPRETPASSLASASPDRIGRTGRCVSVSIVSAVLVAVVAIVAGGCTSSTGGSAAPSTIAPGSPWLGAFDSVTPPTPVNALEDVDCPTVLRCWAVGSTLGAADAPNGAAIISTTNGGVSWSAQTVPASVGYLSGISCSDKRHCAAVGQSSQTTNGAGEIVVTSDGGSTWTPAPVPAGILDVTAVTCLADHWCMATGNTAGGTAALVSSSGLAGWAQVGTLSTGVSGANSISCTDRHDCWVAADSSIDVDHVAGVVDLTDDGGATWLPTSTPKGVGLLDGISCLPSTASSNGLPFSSTTAPPATTAATAATAPPATTAATAPPTPVAAGSATTVPTSTSATAPPATAPPTTAIPPTTTTTAPPGEAGVWCAAVGTTTTTLTGARTGHGVILTTGNGGERWSSEPLSSRVAALMDVSCTAVNTCLSVGSSVSTATQAGVVVLTGPNPHSWKHAAAVGSPQSLSAVSCVSTAVCVVVGESISEHLTAT
jgi:S-DNA-T family DNA segregation ATPase FtsK/SpoIIIE